MTNILGFSGVKQSGKTTCCKFLHGYQLRLHDVVEKFLMDEESNLIINAVQIDENGEEVEGLGILDIERRDEDFIEYSSRSIWPYVRSFSFADPLKIIAIQLFGLTEEQCYGTDEDKNTPVDIKWEDLPRAGMKKGNLTAREFMQYFGTNICRKIKPDIWTQACISRVQSEQSELSVIGDCRFENEVDIIKKAGGKVVRLTRQIFEDDHLSETALNKDKFDWDSFDLIIDNQNMSIEETHDCLLENIQKWGW